MSEHTYTDFYKVCSDLAYRWFTWKNTSTYYEIPLSFFPLALCTIISISWSSCIMMAFTSHQTCCFPFTILSKIDPDVIWTPVKMIHMLDVFIFIALVRESRNISAHYLSSSVNSCNFKCHWQHWEIWATMTCWLSNVPIETLFSIICFNSTLIFSIDTKEPIDQWWLFKF